MNRTDDKQVLAEAKPFIRSVLAFLMFTFRGTGLASIGQCYGDADTFIAELEKDLDKQ
jgi:hypothetical protein